MLLYNCGASHVSASCFSHNGSQLILSDYKIVNLHYDLSSDAQWLPAVMEAIKTIAGSSSHFVGEATIILPGHLLLTKPIKVPLVDVSRQNQIIAFEAQKSIPYPLSEVEWGKQVISDDGVESEVLIAAIKSDVATSFCKEILALGITPKWVSASPILDYNTLLYSYPDLEGETLVVNIGARSSTLIFANPTGFFLRNMPIGGNTLTQNIADALKVSVSDAETVKIDFFAEKLDPASEQFQTVEKLSKSFMTRMSQEITRSIVTYRQQKRGGTPELIFLTGKGALQPGLSQFLSEKQKVSVDYFNSMAGVVVQGSASVDTLALEMYQLSQVVGEAARALVPNAVSIDLTPSEISEGMEFRSKKPFLYMAAACLAISFIPPVIKNIQNEQVISAQIKEVSQKLAVLQNDRSALDKNLQQVEKVAQQIDSFKMLVNSKSNWINFFTDLYERLYDVGDVWIDNLTVQRTVAPPVVIPESEIDQEIVVTPDPAREYNLLLEGRILLRDGGSANVSDIRRTISNRLNSLVESFKKSDFIIDYKNFSPNFTPLVSEGLKLVPFKVTLVVNPEKPL